MRMIPFVAIFGAALSGYASVGPWIIAVAALALFAVSRAENAALYESAQESHHASILAGTTLASALNAFLATGGAYASGLLFQYI